MTEQRTVEELLKESNEIQLAVLKLLAYPVVANEKNDTAKAVKLRRELGLSDELLAAITGVRLDNLRRSLKREGLS